MIGPDVSGHPKQLSPAGGPQENDRWTSRFHKLEEGKQSSMTASRAFVSYSWDDDSHKEWVRVLATHLRGDGVATVLDQWHAVPGDQLSAFMEREIRENHYVLIVCTPNYRLKSDGRQGGVGYEGDIMTAEIFTSGNHRKFIPVLARGTWEEAAPSWVKGKFYVDLSTPANYKKNYPNLTSTMLGTRSVAPPLRKRSAPRSAKPAAKSLSEGPASVDPERSTTTVFSDTALTDKQHGWNGGLGLVLDEFGPAAWRPGLAQERDQVAGNMEAQLQFKMAGKSPAHQQTMTAVVGPFANWLKGESLPSPPFDTALSEVEGLARNEALDIVLGAFERFVRGTGPQSNWTWNEIADNLEKLVEYECCNRSMDYRKAMADLVRPFYRMLKEEPRQTPSFNT